MIRPTGLGTTGPILPGDFGASETIRDTTATAMHLFEMPARFFNYQQTDALDHSKRGLFNVAVWAALAYGSYSILRK